MPEAFDPGAFDEALVRFRFDEAERMAESAPAERHHDLRSRIEAARSRALEAARQRYQRIVELGADGDQEAVAALGNDPSTISLLECLPPSNRRHAEAYLGAARRWEVAQRRTAERRLVEARRALEEFDLQLARGLAHRIERRFLRDEDALDRLLLDIEARRMELAPLREAQRELPHRDRPSRRWWRRRKK